MEFLNRLQQNFLNLSFPHYQKKVRGYLLRDTPSGTVEVLVLKRLGHDENELQVPGGTVDPGEDFLHALNREIYEETGIHFNNNWKKVTTELIDRPKRSTRQFEVAFYQRLEYSIQQSWTHTVTGTGSDCGADFELKWLSIDEAFLRLRPWMADHLEQSLRAIEARSIKSELRNWIRSRISQSSSPQLP